MALVRSREHKVYKTKWNHSCQLRWLPVSHNTLVQEGNYLSYTKYIWQGDTPKISTTHDQNSHVCQAGPSRDSLLEKCPTCHQGYQDTYEKTQKGGVHHSQDITEAGSRPLQTQLSSTRQNAAPRHVHLPWHWPPEALPCWTEDFVCPAVHPGSGDPSLQHADNSLAPVLSPEPAD